MNELIRGLHDEVAEVLARVAPLRDKYAEFNQPRTDVQLRAFVVGQHDTPMRQMHQCLLEISIKDRALRRAQIYRRQALRKISGLSRNDAATRDERALIEIDVEEHDEAILGAARELRTLIAIFDSYKAEFTYEAWTAEELEYWQKRLTRQATHELIANGRVGVGNLDSLRQIGQPVTPAFIQQVEQSLCLPRSGSLSISQEPSPDTSPADSQT